MNVGAPVAIQRRVSAVGIPAPATLRHWARAAMEDTPGEMGIRIVAEDEGRELNARYRGRDYATNVLSFGYGADSSGIPGAPSLLGDLVICKAVVQREAVAQHVPPRAHWAHMVVHGVLHLRGMDHENDADAEHMEAREREILAQLGFPDPYATERPAGTGDSCG
ncbi:MAG: rRNA maturation RNase YbeY [Nevskiaceae bacterium]|nr:MAG: rRNA maturation RNase YbeY [Nevskiaceae bacterium]TBR73067.1 MAG: rRNA maturation RNase YbeY [Nevskiaceae bacterium]